MYTFVQSYTLHREPVLYTEGIFPLTVYIPVHQKSAPDTRRSVHICTSRQQ